MKKVLSGFICGCLVFSMATVVSAEDDYEEQNASVEISKYTCSNTYQSSLPRVMTYNVSFRDIQDEIVRYIEHNGLSIELESEEYLKFMQEIAFYPSDQMDETLLSYFSAYAAMYLNRDSMEAILDKTIMEIRNENLAIEEEQQVASSSETDIELLSYPYDIAKAQKYAADYAMINNFNYPEYGSDCTNYASQILCAGGYPTTSLWNIWAGTGASAWKTWVNAQSFFMYWGSERGHIGNTCFTLASVNQHAKPGDFLLWKEKGTLECYHTQFVQSKVNGYVYCSQHSPYYYNLRLSNQVTEATFKSNIVYQLDFQ